MNRKLLLAAVFVSTFALSRIPELLPPNFSVAYAFAFCSGVYFAGAWAWGLPLGIMFSTDVLLNVFYYHEPPVTLYLALNYAVYALLVGMGRMFGPRAPLLKLLGGGLLGALFFYLATNTLAWIQDAAYAKTLGGWLQALTLGRPEWHPTTWEMFRNTLLGGGLFTALFAATQRMIVESPADKTAGVGESAAESETEIESEEAKA